MKLFQFKYQNNSQNNRYPFSMHLVAEVTISGVAILYIVDSSDPTKVYGSNNKGVTWTQIDVDPSDTSGDQKSRDHQIRGMWVDTTNKIIYFIDGENDEVDTTIDHWKLDYSGGFGSEAVTEVGSWDITTYNASGQWLKGDDVFMVSTSRFVAVYGYIDTGGAQYGTILILNVNSAPFSIAASYDEPV